MSKQHFAGFLVALVVTAAPYIALLAGTALAPAPRGNPAVADGTYTDVRTHAAASPAQIRNANG
ncbi:MAG TPA: hypothetical protein VE046_11120 [Steroidobacteraceae bacterium]|nr:hypothetical protein [Steroidobacteraceae bacterium]